MSLLPNLFIDWLRLGGSGTGKYVELDVQQMDPATRLAKFPLKFVLGTRRAVMSLRFGMQVQTKTGTAVFLSVLFVRGLIRLSAQPPEL
jgi:hypothetical protein